MESPERIWLEIKEPQTATDLPTRAEVKFHSNCPQDIEYVRADIAGVGYSQQTVDALTTERDKYQDALAKIRNWAKAYPLDIFPKPDLKKAHKVLKKAGITLDAISAEAMRHVIDGVKDIAEQALKGE